MLVTEFNDMRCYHCRRVVKDKTLLYAVYFDLANILPIKPENEMVPISSVKSFTLVCHFCFIRSLKTL